ncbi:unnamed protein product [Caenorhabditis bovis]|uniref:SCP domain-containing protein n=1 Tax=Caenorhabditis bovis TaxID=2654633 RepID=A0A8S1EJ99_9PELO|nr:unnamed protein product [Caenorhabditis bovis]
MNLNAFIPPIFVHSHEEQHHTITRKRMERFTADGDLLSVTDVRTKYFDDSPSRPQRHLSRINPDSDSDYYTINTYRTPTTTTSRRREQPLNNREVRHQREVIEREHPIRRIERVERVRAPREFIADSTNDGYRTTDSYVRKTSILKNDQRNRDVTPTSSRVEWREPLDCLIDHMNQIRTSLALAPLQPSVRLADIAAQWAKMLALRGEFRSDRNRLMNIWMGSRVSEAIADVWFDEAVEFGVRNYLDDDEISWVGCASAFSEQHRQFIVVAVYE